MSRKKNENLPEFASLWAHQLGAKQKSLIQLKGGVNNLVFRCSSGLNEWIIKGYATHQTGRQDRMQAEIDFLKYANLVASSRVPELIAIDIGRRCVVMQNFKGYTYPEGIKAPKEDQKAALEFFNELNTDLNTAKLMITMDATESYLDLREHMSNIYERIEGMGTDHLPVTSKDKGKQQIARLRTWAERAEDQLEGQIASGEVNANLDPKLRCVSPGDFGFHNAIRTPKGIKFIDFEFAGWDDPAKTAVDFMLQPRIPVSKELNLSFAGWLQEQAHEITLRMKALEPVLRLKWACIILGVLNPARLASMVIINHKLDIENLLDNRLKSAHNYFTEAK
jgi:hypothetical protein